MELVEGEDLAQRIVRGAIPLDEALPIAKQIAEALEAAHEQRIIHRDLKPANIMVTQQDHVKVLDFGLGKVVRRVVGDGSTTRSMDSHPSAPGGILGTPGYMSPEQLMGRRVDHRSDIWAFGCCLYECLSGRMAFGGETGPERMAATLEREPDFQALAALPGPLHEILRQTLEKNPARRLASLSSALELLAQVGVA
jgi:serine/threonine-protein kinase